MREYNHPSTLTARAPRRARRPPRQRRRVPIVIASDGSVLICSRDLYEERRVKRFADALARALEDLWNEDDGDPA